MVAQQPDGTGIEWLGTLEELGFDYVELSLSHIMNQTEDEFRDFRKILEKSRLGCEACHNFFPGSIRLTGEEVDLEKALEYAGRAIRRVSKLGADVIVFGSAKAKNVPKGFSYTRAWQQIVDLLQRVHKIAERFGITIAIEPVNKKESNIINRVDEALELYRRAKRTSIQVLADYYHMMVEAEDFRIIRNTAGSLRHVHFAHMEGRTYPVSSQQSYRDFFHELKAANYDARVSIEAYSNNFREDAARALKVLRPLARNA